MGHQVFVSHSSRDKSIADALVASLERAGIGCWIAPRDIISGEEWADSILRGILGCQLAILILSRHAPSSPYVRREVERAVSGGKAILTIRLEDVELRGNALELFISACHWFDATIPPFDDHLAAVASQVGRLLANLAGPGAPGDAAPEAGQTPIGHAVGTHGRRVYNLPAASARFVGRGDDLKQIADRFQHRRLVTLQGLGGCGKTQLALQYGRQSLASFRDGVWLIRLESVTDPRLAAAETLRAMGIAEPPRPQDAGDGTAVLPATVGDALSGMQCLLLLDNCEHLEDAPGQLAAAVLSRAPGCHILATSRIPLHVSGESIFVLQGMSLPPEGARRADELKSSDAVSLFLEQLQAQDPQFELTDDMVPAVVSICRRFDGLPLALKLVCSQLRFATLEEIQGQLDQVLPLLQGGFLDVADRHKTMDAAICWSVGTLDGPLRHTFCRLAAFSDGWTPEAAAEVCAAPGSPPQASNVLPALRELCDRSLVTLDRSRRSRYRLIEILRQYAEAELRKLGGDAEAEARDRHLGFYSKLASQSESRLSGAQQKQMLDELDRDHKNMLAALRWCASTENPSPGRAMAGVSLASDLWRFWDMRGHLTVGRAAMEMVLKSAGDDPRCPIRARGLNVAGYLAARQGDYAQAKHLSELALVSRRCLNDLGGEARRLHNLGNVAMATGKYAQAESCYQEALTLNRSVGAAGWEAGILGRLADLYARVGRLDEARRYAADALSLNTTVGNASWAAIDYQLIGDICHDSRDTAGARQNYRKALEIRHDLGEKPRAAVTLTAIARLALSQAEPALAARLLIAAEALGKTIGEAPEPDDQRRLGEMRAMLLKDPVAGPLLETESQTDPWATAVADALRWLKT